MIIMIINSYQILFSLISLHSLFTLFHAVSAAAACEIFFKAGSSLVEYRELFWSRNLSEKSRLAKIWYKAYKA